MKIARGKVNNQNTRSLSGPGVFAVLISLFIHATVCAAILVVADVSVPEPEPEPQPAALVVEIITENPSSGETPQEVREGDAEAEAESEAAPEDNTLEDLTKKELAEDIHPVELPVPDTVPLPVKRPAPEKRKADEKRPDKTELAAARGIRDKPDPDVQTGDVLQNAGDVNAPFAPEMSRGMVRDTPAEQRWQAQLAAHLQRRKRYPHRALSRRQEGIVHVRFHVDTDGTVLAPELAQSSGISELDDEVLDLVQRASPVPRPPPNVKTFVTVPVSFNIR